jgi:neurotransmitter:Na+ symporter, NSS family
MPPHRRSGRVCRVGRSFGERRPEIEGQRSQWATRTGFIFAAVGSAIGLGNIWRYPSVVYENGGGAFLLPYFIALVTAGIPLLILEYAIGNKYRAAGPGGYGAMSRRWSWLGWWQATVSFVIGTYYMVIIGWAIGFTFYAFGTRWGGGDAAESTEDFFLGSFLGLSDDFWIIGGIQLNALIFALIAWAIVYTLLQLGVKRGIELAARVLIPLLVVMLLAITIRGLTLPGAIEGLNALLTPDLSALSNTAVWVAAYGQVFFSLSLAFTVMITYASYLPRRSELSNSGFIMAFANSGFEFLAALGIFSVLGFLAVQQNVPVNEAVESGVILAFVSIPEIINQFPGLNSLFGVLFFGGLTFAGLTSAVSIFEVGIAAVSEKFNLSRAKAVNIVCGAAFVISMLYITNGGLYYLDTVDNFINNYGLVLSAIVEVVFVAWIVRQLPQLRQHINEGSYIRLGFWWEILLKFVTPLALVVVVGFNIVNEISEPYEGYPVSGILVFGVGGAVLALVVGVVLHKVRGGGDEAGGGGTPQEAPDSVREEE